MPNISLYHAAAEVQHQIALCVDPETGELDTEKMDSIACTFKDRAVATIAVYKGKGHTIDTLTSYLGEIQEQIKREKAQQERLKDYLHAAMIVAGVDKIKSDDCLLNATLYKDRDESLEVEEGFEFPAELCNKPKKPEPSKTLIKEAILSGQPIAGARIVRKDRLAIK
jgi:thioredoxin-related protein